MARQRIEDVRKYIDLHGEASVEDLVELCGGCSKMTIWRYLQRLEEEGAIRRIRGGAISNNVRGDIEGLYSQRMYENTEAKRRIAGAALPYLEPLCSIFLDAGSTIMSMVKQLPNLRYTIITSGTNIAIELSQRYDMSVSCVGGQISGSTLSLSGPQAEAFLDTVNIDTAVLSASGYSQKGGFSIGSYTESLLKRRAIEKAGRVILLMDRSKLERTLPFTFASLADIHVLICDGPLPEALLAEAREQGVEVVEV